jgi:hypothetical protein
MLALVIFAVLVIAFILYYRSLSNAIPEGLYKYTNSHGYYNYVSLKKMVAGKDLCECKTDCFDTNFEDTTKYEPGFIMFFISQQNQEPKLTEYKEENGVPTGLSTVTYFYTPSTGPYAGAMHTQIYSRLCYYKNLKTGDYECRQKGGPVYSYVKILKKFIGSDNSTLSFQSEIKK